MRSPSFQAFVAKSTDESVPFAVMSATSNLPSLFVSYWAQIELP